MDRPSRFIFLLAILLLVTAGCAAPAAPAPGAGASTVEASTIGFVTGRYAFVPRDRQVLVLDVADPAHPRSVAAWDAPGRVQRIVIAGRTAYVAHQPSVESWDSTSGPPDGGIQLVDVASPLHPRPLGLYRSNTAATTVAVLGDVAYVADWAGVSAVDVRRPSAPAEIARLPQGLSGMQVSGRRLTGAYGDCSVRGHCSGGLWLADLTEPRHPVELGRLDSVSPPDGPPGGMPGYDVAVVGRYAYVAGFGVWTVDLADPGRPVQVSAIRANGGFYHTEVEASDTDLFVFADGLYVYDLAQGPALAQLTPLQGGYLPLENVSPSDMVLRGGYLYLAANGGLYVVDVRDPRHPALAGTAAATPIAPPMPTPAPTACERFPDPPSRLASASQRPAVPDPPLAATLSRRPVAYAAHTLYLDATVARLAAGAGFDTAVQVFPWRDLNPEPGVYTWDAADDMVRNAQAAGLNLVIRLDMPPDWARTPGGVRPADGARPPEGVALPFDLAAYADYVSAVASRYRGHVVGYIIWNEPNLAAEWSRSGDGSVNHWSAADGRVADPAEYVGVLGVAYRRIAAADPAARVISAGLAPTNENSPRARDDRTFLAAMLAAGAARCFDAVGQHAYGYGQDPSQTEAGPVASGAAQPGLQRVAEWRQILLAHGVNKPVWITELGYTIDPGAQPAVTPWQQADYLARVVTRAGGDWSWVALLTVWNLSYGAAAGDEAGGFSLVDAEAAPRPAYRRLQAVIGGGWRAGAVAPPQAGG